MARHQHTNLPVYWCKLDRVKNIFLIVFVLFIARAATAQVLPLDRQVLWAGAGTPSTNPVIVNEVKVMSFGAYGDSTHDDAMAIANAIASLAGHAGVVFFPPGKYLIRSTVTIPDSVILRGDCNDSAELVFDLGGASIDCIDVQANVTDTFQSILAGFSKDTTVIRVANTAGFSIGDYAEIVETNGAWDAVPIWWATNCVGQIVHITAITGDYLTFENPLRITYSPLLMPRIRKWIPRVFVGIEDMKITRADTIAPASGYQVSFRNAMNCWVKGVESTNSAGAHVSMDACTGITVSGCYFHDAYAYDGTSTRGYGVMMIQHTGQCLVENNVFDHLRHAVMVKQGANGNVVGYNYAVNGYRVELPNDAGADLVCHGHYPFANLFESNSVNNIMVDSTWGPTGPYTTFYRNHAALYGIIMTPGASVLSDSLNWVGNETTNGTTLHGFFLLAGTNHYEYGNNILGAIVPAGTTSLTDTSYYREIFTDIFSSASFLPAIGLPNAPGSGNIPARQRYLAGGKITVSSSPPCATSRIPENGGAESVRIYPNPATSFITVSGTDDRHPGRYSICNALGDRVIEGDFVGSSYSINVSKLINGVYFLKILQGNCITDGKFVVMGK